MHKEEEIAKGSDDEKRVGDPGSVPIQAKSIKYCIEQTSYAKEREMLFHSFGIYSVLFLCRVDPCLCGIR